MAIIKPLRSKGSFCRISIDGASIHSAGYIPVLLRIARRLQIPKFEADIIEGPLPRIVVHAGGDGASTQEFLETVKTKHPRNAKVTKVLVEEKPSRNILSIDDYQKIFIFERQDKFICAWADFARKAEEYNQI